MKRLDLEHYRKDLDWLDPDFGPRLSKAAVYCLVEQGHPTGVEFTVSTSGEVFRFGLDWETMIDLSQSKTLPNEEEMTQRGAECLSLLLANEILGLPYFITAQKGTGVDFWLKSDPFSIFVEAGMEVSGIRKSESGNSLEGRLRQKQEQVRKAGSQNLTYISVVEFSQPEAKVEAL